jgi:ribonuclease P protein component
MRVFVSAGRSCRADRRSVWNRTPSDRSTCKYRNTDYEAHLSTQHPSSSQETRFSRPYGNTSGSCCLEGAPPQGPHSPVRLSSRPRTEQNFIGELTVERSDMTAVPHGEALQANLGASLRSSTVWSLRGTAAFRDMRGSGRSCKQDRFVVQSRRGDIGSPVILGLIVGKSVGNAVVRNRIRRQVRAVIRELSGELAGSTVVVRALPGAADTSYRSLSSTLRVCLVGTTR